MSLPAEIHQTTEEISERDPALELADRAEALARELLVLPKESRQRAAEAFFNKQWTPQEIKALLSSISIKLFRRLISRRMS
jgi:hypothetical protein